MIPGNDNKMIATLWEHNHPFTHSPIHPFIHSFIRWQNSSASYPSVPVCSIPLCPVWSDIRLIWIWIFLSFSRLRSVCLKTRVKLCATRDPSAYPYPLSHSYSYSFSYMLMQSNVCTAFVCARELLEIYLHAFNWHSSGGDQRQPPPVALPTQLPGQLTHLISVALSLFLSLGQLGSCSCCHN